MSIDGAAVVGRMDDGATDLPTCATCERIIGRGERFTGGVSTGLLWHARCLPASQPAVAAPDGDMAVEDSGVTCKIHNDLNCEQPVCNPTCMDVDDTYEVPAPARRETVPDGRWLELAHGFLEGLTVDELDRMTDWAWTQADCTAALDYLREIDQWNAWLKLQVLLMARDLEAGQQSALATRLRNVAAEVTR
ncbi:hypothetical protein [Frankia sp. Cj3]|uniref:hypothetical protein n=1 Tax=Frankia sp. Cj3 TaxID=2880976 RepID=UPI001EF4E260|nr:hypothetical protein [Frankia sp. Cj3]